MFRKSTIWIISWNSMIISVECIKSSVPSSRLVKRTVVYLIRVAIKRTPGGPNNFNETRIFVGEDSAALSRKREKEWQEIKEKTVVARLHFAPDLLFLFSIIPRFPYLAFSRVFFFSFLHPFTLITPARKRECECGPPLAFSFCFHARCVATATLMGFPSLKRSSGLWS